MIKILIEGMTNNRGGKETYIINMYNAMDKDKYQFTFIAYDEKIAYEDYLLETGAEIIHLPPRHAGLIAHKSQLDKLLTKIHFDVVWSHKTTLSACELLVSAKKHGVPVRIVHSHSSANMGGKFTYIMHHMNKLFIRRWANEYFACSDKAAKWFYGNYPVKIMKNGIDLDRFKFNENIRNIIRAKLDLDGYFVIGHIGRFGAEKNHKKLLNVFHEYIKTNNRSKLILVGDGEERENIEHQITALGLNDCVILLGIVDNVNEILQAIDLIVMPSLFEGLPFALLEAQTAGLKCVVSDTVSHESDIMGWNVFLPLDLDDIGWTDEIDKISLNYDRYEGFISMNKHNYDINESVRCIDDIILSLL